MILYWLTIAVTVLFVIWAATHRAVIRDAFFDSRFSKEPFRDTAPPITTFWPSARILFLTMDTRVSSSGPRPSIQRVVALHNRNMMLYCAANGYEYKFFSKCDVDRRHKHQPYWCKLYLVNRELATGAYDVVVWVDTDVRFNHYTPVSKFLDPVDASIYMAYNKGKKTLNAGVFFVRPSGSHILEECMDVYESPEFKEQCVSKTGLRGLWSSLCYEQGVLGNTLLKYPQEMGVLPASAVHNHFEPAVMNPLMEHLYRSSPQQLEKWFLKGNII
jgi:hypothetical protein